MTPVAYIASVVVLVHPITSTGSMYPDVMFCLGDGLFLEFERQKVKAHLDHR